VKQQAGWNSVKSRRGPAQPSNREPMMSPAIAPSMLDRLNGCSKVNSMSIRRDSETRCSDIQELLRQSF
jgi:hypothetical protein